MKLFPRILFAGAILLTAALLLTVQGQGIRRRAGTVQPSNSAPRKTTDPQDKWGAAQRSIESAIQHLEAYLRRYPSGERAEHGRRQLQVLRSLTAAASQPEWTRLHLGPAVTSDWRVASIDPQPDQTRLTLEIRCAQDFNGECGFPAFASTSPLVLLDNSGRYYRMIQAGDVPEGVRRVDDHPAVQYRFQPGRTITVEVEFAPLAKDVVSGQVQYGERNLAVPAKFSLARHR